MTCAMLNSHGSMSVVASNVVSTQQPAFCFQAVKSKAGRITSAASGCSQMLQSLVCDLVKMDVYDSCQMARRNRFGLEGS